MVRLAATLGASSSDKLTLNNHLFSKIPVLLVLPGAHVMGLLDGSDLVPEKNLEVEDAEKKRRPSCQTHPMMSSLLGIKPCWDI
jgi:hypothetical protein